MCSNQGIGGVVHSARVDGKVNTVLYVPSPACPFEYMREPHEYRTQPRADS